MHKTAAAAERRQRWLVSGVLIITRRSINLELKQEIQSWWLRLFPVTKTKGKLRDSWYKILRHTTSRKLAAMSHSNTRGGSDRGAFFFFFNRNKVALDRKCETRRGLPKRRSLDAQHDLVYTSACPLEGRRSEQQGKRNKSYSRRNRGEEADQHGFRILLWNRLAFAFPANIVYVSPYSDTATCPSLKRASAVRDLFKTEHLQKQIQKY